MAKTTDQHYQSFLIRCWLTRPSTTDELPTWRFELREVTAESQVVGFSDVAELTSFISAKMSQDMEDRNE